MTYTDPNNREITPTLQVHFPLRETQLEKQNRENDELNEIIFESEILAVILSTENKQWLAEMIDEQLSREERLQAEEKWKSYIEGQNQTVREHTLAEQDHLAQVLQPKPDVASQLQTQLLLVESALASINQQMLNLCDGKTKTDMLTPHANQAVANLTIPNSQGSPPSFDTIAKNPVIQWAGIKAATYENADNSTKLASAMAIHAETLRQRLLTATDGPDFLTAIKFTGFAKDFLNSIKDIVDVKPSVKKIVEFANEYCRADIETFNKGIANFLKAYTPLERVKMELNHVKNNLTTAISSAPKPDATIESTHTPRKAR